MTLPNQQSFSYRIAHSDISYIEPPTTLAAITVKKVVIFPAAGSFVSMNLATLFPEITVPNVLTLQDITNNAVAGFAIALTTGQPGLQIKPNGIFSCSWNPITALPTLFISNPSSLVPTQLLVVIIGS